MTEEKTGFKVFSPEEEAEIRKIALIAAAKLYDGGGDVGDNAYDVITAARLYERYLKGEL